jgi:predicted dehydrogenase
MANSYRVAMIGCGGRARAHVNALKADTRCQVVGLADVRKESAESMNADSGFGAAIYTDHREMLAKERPDVVISCLWTPLHLPVFRDCVKAGSKAVLSEKPMAPTWGECLDMAHLAETSGCLLTFCHQRRFSPGNLLARKLLQDGVFGEIRRMDLYSPPNLLDCGTHSLDQALSFNNEVPAKWVLAAVDTSELVHWFDVTAESVATGQIVFQNGVRASFQFGGPDMDLWGGVRVIGTKGHFSVIWDGEVREAVLYGDPDWRFPSAPVDHEIEMQGVVTETLNCLESGEEPALSHKKALRAAEIIFACYESVRRHARVELPLDGFRDNPLHDLLKRK